VEFEIEAGTEDGERIALKGEGDEIVRHPFPRSECKALTTQPGVPAGDVIFHIHIRPHPAFRPLPNAGLAMTLSISLSEALLGMNRLMFAHLDGRGIRLESKRGERIIKHGDELLVKGEGMPMRGRTARGDLRVRFEVEMPGLSWAARTDPNVSHAREVGKTVELTRPVDDGRVTFSAWGYRAAGGSSDSVPVTFEVIPIQAN
jgi:DnaJ family protein A protein 2